MRRLKIMTWNVLYKEKADNILSLVKQINPDILCCQEITTDSHINPGRNVPLELSKLLKGGCVYQQILSAMEKHPGSMGNAIISRFPIVGDSKVFVQRGNSDIDYSKQNRGYLEAYIKLGLENLTVGTTHLSFVPGFSETDSRSKEADKLIQKIRKHTKRFLITGDFNSAPTSSTIQKLEKLFVSVGPNHKQNTFTTKPFTHGKFTVNDLEWRLDYIFTTKDIKVLSKSIVNTDTSDHLPIVAEVQI